MTHDERRRALLAALRSRCAAGVSPSVRELGRLTDIPSASTVWRLLRELESEGSVRFLRGEDGAVTAVVPCEPDGRRTVQVRLLTSLDPVTGRETPALPERFIPFLLPERMTDGVFAVSVKTPVCDLQPGDVAVFAKAAHTPPDRPAALSLYGRLTVGVVRQSETGAYAEVESRVLRLGSDADVCVVGRLLGFTRFAD